MNINKPQYARLLFIDEKIRGGSYPNATSIADEYEISSRTITRDIEYMRDSLGAPIEYDSSRKGYCYTETNFFLPAIEIKESDFFALCITEKALKQYENTPLYEKLSVIFDKLKEYLPDSIRVNTSWIDNQFTFIHESFTTINPEIWETVSQSLRIRSRLKIIHQKAGSSEALERLVDPYHLVNYRGEWYLVGYCHTRNSVIRFAISRIQEARLLNVKYEIPSDFNFNEFIGSSFGIMSEDVEHSVEILFNKSQAPYIVERQWQPDQKIIYNEDGSIILSFKTNSLFEVKRWVLSWGSDAQVLSPDILVEQVSVEANKMNELYKIEITAK